MTTVERMRGSASARHMSASKPVISSERDQSRRPSALRGGVGSVLTGRAHGVPSSAATNCPHVGDVLVHGRHAPLRGVDRRQDVDVHGAAPQGLVPAPHHLAGVVDDDRHHRHARLHRDVERALLERPEPRGRRAGALGRDGQRPALVAHLAHRGLEGLLRLPGVAALDERDAGQLNIWPHSGIDAASAFATPVKPPRSSFISRATSSLDWWLKTKTHGRADHRCSAPRTRRRRCRPARARGPRRPTRRGRPSGAASGARARPPRRCSPPRAARRRTRRCARRRRRGERAAARRDGEDGARHRSRRPPASPPGAARPPPAARRGTGPRRRTPARRRAPPPPRPPSPPRPSSSTGPATSPVSMPSRTSTSVATSSSAPRSSARGASKAGWPAR